MIQNQARSQVMARHEQHPNKLEKLNWLFNSWPRAKHIENTSLFLSCGFVIQTFRCFVSRLNYSLKQCRFEFKQIIIFIVLIHDRDLILVYRLNYWLFTWKLSVFPEVTLSYLTWGFRIFPQQSYVKSCWTHQLIHTSAFGHNIVKSAYSRINSWEVLMYWPDCRINVVYVLGLSGTKTNNFSCSKHACMKFKLSKK